MLTLANSHLNNRDLFSKVFTINTNLLLGRILKDEQTLESYKIEAGVTVHLVKAKATGDAPATAT